MEWRLGLDMGTNSLGWAVLKVGGSQAVSLVDLGVRIFSDGRLVDKSGNVGDSLAVERTAARQIARQRDRTRQRKKILMKVLGKAGLFPSQSGEQKKLELENPYFLRARAVNEPLSAHFLGRALYHLAVRRGFKSNRKTDGKEDSAFFDKISRLKEQLGNKTLGQYLAERLERGERTRFSKEDECDLFPRREMYELEFQTIKSQQQPHHSVSEELWNEIERVIFYQRPLRPVERGKCSLFPEHERAFEGLAISHLFRIVQEVNNLNWQDSNIVLHDLTNEQRHLLHEKLRGQVSVKFDAMRKMKDENGQLLFPDCRQFNLERGKRKFLKGHKIDYDFSKPEMLGSKWGSFSADEQNDLITLLYEAEEADKLLDELVARYDLSDEQAENLVAYKLPRNSTMKLSRYAMEQLVPIMMKTGMTYDKAVGELKNEYGQPMHHSHKATGEIFDSLPYYGEVLTGSTQNADPEKADPVEKPEKHFGKIGNPTVHIALNQLRKLVNELIELYGPPSEIHVELSRDMKKARKHRDEITKRSRDNEKERRRILKDYLVGLGIPDPTALDYKKIQLWEELEGGGMSRTCPYSGDAISAKMLFNGEAQIEHILPFSKTLDNSRGNLTVATADANRSKSNHTPYEAFGSNQSGKFDWSGILARAAKLPEHKQWRFSEQAMERFAEDSGFIARQLTDNAYISRKTVQYLECICDPHKIVSVSGQLTGLLRGKWGLNGLLSNDNQVKNREDHRHHAIDAVVIAMTTRSRLQKINTKRAADGRNLIQVPEFPDSIRQQLREQIGKVIISLKPDHSPQGKLFKKTAYGFVDEAVRKENHKDHNVVVRKPLMSLSRKNLDDIRDETLRELIIAYVDDPVNSGRKLEHILADFKDHDKLELLDLKQPIKNVRVLEKWQTVRRIASASFKGYVPDSYVCCYIWRVPKGKKGAWKKGQYEWKGTYYSHVDMANLPEDKNKLKPRSGTEGPFIGAARLEMVLYKDDIVSLERDGQQQYFKVFGFSTTNNKLDLRPLNESKSPQKFYSINSVMQQNLRKVMVSVTGKVRR